MEHTFSIEQTLRSGWKKTRAHSGLVFKAILTLFAVQIAQSIVSKVLEGTFIGVGATIVLVAASIYIGIGFTRIAFKLAKEEHTVYADIIPPWDLVWRYALASLLSGLIIGLGFLLLIIPGIYFALRFSMVRFAILEGAGVKESLRKSSAMTEGKKWHILGFFIVFAVINILGAMLFLVGLLITVPVTLIAYAEVYRHLAHRVEGKS